MLHLRRSVAYLFVLFFILFKAINPLFAIHTSELQKTLKHALDGLLSEDYYDAKQRPDIGGPPLDIEIGIEIEGIDKVSEVDMDYTLTFDFHQVWRDRRLIFKNSVLSNLSLTLDNRVVEQIWVPDIYLSNDKKSYLHEITTNNRLLRLEPGGRVYYGLRITAELKCEMDLARYPLDKQYCWMELESYGYSNEEIRFRLFDEKEKAMAGLENVKLTQFQLTDSNISITNTKFSRGEYSAAVVCFSLQRNIGFFILQTYVPSSLLTILSWVSFWINHESTSARIALCITAVLAITTISNNSRKSLPKIPDVKALDVYLIACFIFVFCGMMEYVFVNCMHGANVERAKKQQLIKKRNKKAKRTTEKELRATSSENRRNTIRKRVKNCFMRVKKFLPSAERLQINDVTAIDKIARVGFPAVFVLFNCFYWTYYNFF